MLPDRSKRHAGVDGETPRLQLASNWQLMLVAVLMIGLLRVIFPQKALVEKLYDQERLDELTLSYIENLHRTEPSNVDLTILLGRVQRDTMDIDNLDHLLQPVIRAGNARQRDEATPGGWIGHVGLLLTGLKKMGHGALASTAPRRPERARADFRTPSRWIAAAKSFR